MSLLSYFKKVNTLPTAEETSVGKKAMEEANKRVTEVLRHKKGKRKRKATAHSKETRAKIDKFAAVNGAASARRYFKKSLNTVRKYKNAYEREASLHLKNDDSRD